METFKIQAVRQPVSVFRLSEKNWDHKGRTQFVRILVSHTSRSIRTLQFQYLEKGGLTSEIVGCPDFNGSTLSTITFKSRHEYVTKVEGVCGAFIEKLWIQTNTQMYKVFESESPSSIWKEKFSFNFVGKDHFGGLHGTFNTEGLCSIGVYFNNHTTLPAGFC